MNSIIWRVRNLMKMARLSATARSVRRAGLTYLSLPKLHRLEAALAEVLGRKIPGDIVEFGVALGGSSIILADRARRHGRNFHGFDVFGMIPPPTSDKDDAKSRARYLRIAEGKSEGIGGETYYGYRDNLYDDVCRAFDRHNLKVGGPAISLHKGLFEETVPKAGLGVVALAHIDCDWYDPVSYCLSQIDDRLSPGGIILIDDYHDYGGCRQATDEFLEAHPDFRFEDGENIILRRTGPAPGSAKP